jgi:hypothetical protein
MRHDVFKSDIKQFQDNVSFRKNVVEIVKRDHTHIYHTISSQCKKLEYTNAVGGHFHKVVVEMDGQGNLVAKCSEPLRIRHHRLPNGSFKKVIEPVSFYDGMNDKNVVDNHTHKFEYMHSEMISVDSSKKISNFQEGPKHVEGFKDLES